MQACVFKFAPMVVQNHAAPPRRSCRLIAQTSREKLAVSTTVRAVTVKAVKRRERTETEVSEPLEVAPDVSKPKRRRANAASPEPLPYAPGPEPLAEQVVAKAKQPKKTKAPKIPRAGPTREMEERLWKMGYQNVCGVDEAGRGPLAGPVVAAACVIPHNIHIQGIDDSKKLTADQREGIYQTILASPGVLYAVEIIDEKIIDEVNILQATMLAMASCVKTLQTLPGGSGADYVLIDGNRLPEGMPTDTARFVIKGDAQCHVIAAASIIAKVTRDRIMMDYDRKWPQYGFKDHKGYGTAGHMATLREHGPCQIHRRSFAPIKDWPNLDCKG